MKKVFVAIILSLVISMTFVACNPDKEKKEIEKMDFSHEKEGVIYLAGGCFLGTELLMQSMNGVI